MNLRHMQTDQSGSLSSVNIGDNLDLKLMERGLVPGTEITVVGHAPLHDPIKRHINGQPLPLPLRNNEADHIKLTAAAIEGNR